MLYLRVLHEAARDLVQALDVVAAQKIDFQNCQDDYKEDPAAACKQCIAYACKACSRPLC